MSLYEAVKAALSFLFRLMGWEIQGAENFPKDGPVIMISNHVSMWDPFVAACSVPRQVAYMAKEELFSIPLLGMILRKLGVFAVKRGEGDMSAIRHSLNLLKEQKVLALFPEGTRSKTGEAQKGMPGMVFLMEKSKAPVVPVKVFGTKGLLTKNRGNIRVIIGKPISPDKLKAPEGIVNRRDWVAQQIMDRLNAMQ